MLDGIWWRRHACRSGRARPGHGLRVERIVAEAPGVVSVEISGTRLEQLQVRPGQFFCWRFLTSDRWWESHPFSLSAPPDGRRLRITVKDLGDYTAALRSIPPGTRVLAEGPYGSFTADARRRPRVALIAGGIVAMFLFQAFINVGMNVGIMPITGIPLPLLSYGGSSVITTLLAIGLLQSIYAQGRFAAAAKRRSLSF